METAVIQVVVVAPTEVVEGAVVLATTAGQDAPVAHTLVVEGAVFQPATGAVQVVQVEMVAVA